MARPKGMSSVSVSCLLVLTIEWFSRLWVCMGMVLCCVCVFVCVCARICMLYVCGFCNSRTGALVIGMWDNLYKDCNNGLDDITSARWPNNLGTNMQA